jgi:hypothetical protein
MNQDISKKEKEEIVNESMNAITQICLIHKMHIETLPRPIINLLIDVFQAGATVALNIKDKKEIKI